MKATGYVRHIDDLGRIVIPKELRRALRLREGEPLELFTDGGTVILHRYSPIGKISDLAEAFATALNENTGLVVLVADRDTIVAVAGTVKKGYINEQVSAGIEALMADRKPGILPPGNYAVLWRQAADKATPPSYTAIAVVPIVSLGDPVGAFILCSTTKDAEITDAHLLAASTAASFLGNYYLARGDQP